MKKILTIMLMAFSIGIAVQAQEADYQPLVREGVRWVNEHKIEWGDHTDCDIYRYEFSGDTIINGIEYKKCYRYKNQNLNQDSDVVYAVMREQGHKVYAIAIDDPIFGFFYRDENGNEVNEYQFENNYEALLFDFDDPDALYDDLYYPRIGLSQFMNGVGFDSKINGDAFHPFTGIETNQEYFETYGLRHIEDQNGNVIYKGYAYTDNTYQPLVREGVVWHYAYYKMNVESMPEYGSSIIDYKVQFKGDTLVNGIAYKKCYIYDTESLEESSKPVALAREADGAVMFTDTNQSMWYDYSSWLETTLPGEYYQLTGERIVYDFGNMPEFIANIKKQNQAYEFFQMELIATDQVCVADKTVNRYTLTGSFMYPNSYYVESVGVDGYKSGYLFNPLVDIPTCICSGSLGLIKLTDLDGNILYKGVNYEDYYSGISKMNDNKALLVQQNAHSLNVTTPCDGMVNVIDMAGHIVINRVALEGETEISTTSLAAGVYIVQLSTPTGTHTTKVVIK